MNKAMVKFVKAKAPSYRVEDNLIEAMGISLAYICVGVLHAKTDEFEGRIIKLENFHNFIQEEKQKSDISTSEGTQVLLDEAKGPRSYIYEACYKIPTSQLFYLAEVTPKTASKNPSIRAYLQAGFCIVAVWTDRVLKEHYRMNKEKRIKVFEDMVNWIDSYQKKYQSNNGIRQLYLEELEYDLNRGEKVG